MNKRIRRKHEKQMAKLETFIDELRAARDAAMLASLSMAALPPALREMYRPIQPRP